MKQKEWDKKKLQQTKRINLVLNIKLHFKRMKQIKWHRAFSQWEDTWINNNREMIHEWNLFRTVFSTVMKIVKNPQFVLHF